jgi:hypothetical protein
MILSFFFETVGGPLSGSRCATAGFILFPYVCIAVGDPIRGECWDHINKRGVLGSHLQEESVRITLTRGECWDHINKRGVLRSH